MIARHLSQRVDLPRTVVVDEPVAPKAGSVFHRQDFLAQGLGIAQKQAHAMGGRSRAAGTAPAPAKCLGRARGVLDPLALDHQIAGFREGRHGIRPFADDRDRRIRRPDLAGQADLGESAAQGIHDLHLVFRDGLAHGIVEIQLPPGPVRAVAVDERHAEFGRALDVLQGVDAKRADGRPPVHRQSLGAAAATAAGYARQTMLIAHVACGVSLSIGQFRGGSPLVDRQLSCT